MKPILLFLCSMLFSTLVSADAFKKGYDIAKKNQSANEGFIGEESKMELKLIDAHGTEIVRKLVGKTLEVKRGESKGVIIFKKPADVKGTKLLTWTYESKDDDQWLYLKSLKRVKRISSSGKTSSFMGSEFSYEDLGSQSPEKFKFKYIKDAKIGKRKVWVMERFPKDKKSAYKRMKTWVDKVYNGPLKVEYYDRKNELLKTAKFSGYKKYKVKGKNIYRASQIHMKNVQTLKQSVFKWEDRKLGKKYSSRKFSKKSLKD